MQPLDLKQHLSSFHEGTEGDERYHDYLHLAAHRTIGHKHAADGSVIHEEKVQEPPYKLVYMEDLKPGMQVLDTEHEHDDEDGPQMPSIFGTLMGVQQQNCKTVYRKNIVVEVRSSADVYAVILVDEDGKQQPFYGPSLRLVPVATEQAV